MVEITTPAVAAATRALARATPTFSFASAVTRTEAKVPCDRTLQRIAATVPFPPRSAHRPATPVTRVPQRDSESPRSLYLTRHRSFRGLTRAINGKSTDAPCRATGVQQPPRGMFARASLRLLLASERGSTSAT